MLWHCYCWGGVFFSCQENKQPEPLDRSNKETSDAFQKNGQTVSNQSGRLVFASQNAFQQVIQDLSQRTTGQLDTWETALGFVSVRSVNKLLVADHLQDHDTKLTDDFDLPDFFASITNANGEFVIADTVVYLHGGFSYHIPLSQESNLKSNGVFNLVLIQNYPKREVKTEYLAKRKEVQGNYDAKYQYEYDAEGRRWKIVYEVASFHYWSNHHIQNEIRKKTS